MPQRPATCRRGRCVCASMRACVRACVCLGGEMGAARHVSRSSASQNPGPGRTLAPCTSACLCRESAAPLVPEATWSRPACCISCHAVARRLCGASALPLPLRAAAHCCMLRLKIRINSSILLSAPHLHDDVTGHRLRDHILCRKVNHHRRPGLAAAATSAAAYTAACAAAGACACRGGGRSSDRSSTICRAAAPQLSCSCLTTMRMLQCSQRAAAGCRGSAAARCARKPLLHPVFVARECEGSVHVVLRIG
jgi:hypothetical protein